MKRGVCRALFATAIILFFFPASQALSDGETAAVQSEGVGVSVSGSVSNTASGTGTGATVERSATGMTIRGISSSVVNVNNRVVQGSAEGTLRINWSGQDRSRGSGTGSPVTPPGAPELPANWMFGTGFMVFGFGLLLYRRRVV
jgi:hypothetical protein